MYFFKIDIFTEASRFHPVFAETNSESFESLFTWCAKALTKLICSLSTILVSKMRLEALFFRSLENSHIYLSTMKHHRYLALGIEEGSCNWWQRFLRQSWHCGKTASKDWKLGLLFEDVSFYIMAVVLLKYISLDLWCHTNLNVPLYIVYWLHFAKCKFRRRDLARCLLPARVFVPFTQ